MIKAITFVFLMLTIGACSAVADTDQFKVGVILPLTGPAAEYGIAAKNGMILAQKDTPELFERINFIFEDSRHDAKLALTALKKLQTVDKIDVAISWGVGPTKVVAPITEKSKTPLVAITADGSVSENRNYVVRFNYTAERYSEALVAYLHGCGYKKIGIIKTEVPYFESIIEGMTSSLSSDQKLEIVSSLQGGDSDFRSIIPRVALRHYDAVGIFLVTGQISAFYQQASQLKFDAPFFGTDFFESRAEIEKAGPSVQGTAYPAMNVSDDFRSRYVSMFGNDLQIAYAGNAYDAAMLTAQSLQHAAMPLNPGTMVNRMIQSDFNGVSGKYRANTAPEARGFDPQLVIKEIGPSGISLLSIGSCPRSIEIQGPDKPDA